MELKELDVECHKRLKSLGLQGKLLQSNYDAYSWLQGKRRVVITRRKEKGDYITVQVEGRWHIRTLDEFNQII